MMPMSSTGRSLPAASDHENVIFGVRNITNTSAILEWDTPGDRPILKFKVSPADSLVKTVDKWTQQPMLTPQ